MSTLDIILAEVQLNRHCTSSCLQVHCMLLALHMTRHGFREFCEVSMWVLLCALTSTQHTTPEHDQRSGTVPDATAVGLAVVCCLDQCYAVPAAVAMLTHLCP